MRVIVGVLDHEDAIRVGTGAIDGNRGEGIEIRSLHGITPETATSAHYFWGYARNFALDDETVGTFVRRAILDEIVPSLRIDPTMAETFAHAVIDRFANPFVAHALRDITFQQTAKLGVRVAPSIREYVETHGEAPPLLCFGVAALLAAVRPGGADGLSADDAAGDWERRWADVDLADTDELRAFTVAALGRWDLDTVEGVPESVADALVAVERDGCRAALAARL